MTSIRSFSEILMSDDRMPAADRRRYSQIIHDETIRLTRLLDDLLDLSVLENGQVVLNEREDTLENILDRAVSATEKRDQSTPLLIERERMKERVTLFTDSDRLAQVFINLISNAQKYCDAELPSLRIAVRDIAGRRVVDFIDNGTGIPRDAQQLIFEKFARGTDHRAAGGAGLGLAISREVMNRLGGAITYLPGQGGAAFRVTLPRRQAEAA
jgi:signal transduction histidine kinase